MSREVSKPNGVWGRLAPVMKALAVVILALKPGMPAAAQEGVRAAGSDGLAFRVVVNANHPESAITLQEVGEIFRKEIEQWDGTPVVPVDLPTRSPVRESFSLAAHGRPGPAMDAFWRRQVFSGRGSPPVVLESDQEVLDYLARHPNAIGYVGRNTRLPAGVKALRIEVPEASAVYAAGAVDELPVGTSRPTLAYPPDLLARRVEGMVRLEYTIDETGHVMPTSIRVLESTHKGFEEPAIDWVAGSMFRPGRVAGTPVAVMVQQTVRFNLN